MPKKAYIALLLLIFPCIVQSSELYDQIEVLSSDNRGMHFVLKIEDPSRILHHVSDRNSSYYLGYQVVIGVPSGAEPIITRATGSEPLEAIGGNFPVEPFGGSFAVIHDVKTIRGRKTASIMLYPYTGSTPYGRIEVWVDFAGQSQDGTFNVEISEASKVFDPILKYTLLNYDRAVNWPVEKRAIAAKTAISAFTQSSEWYRVITSLEGLTAITGNVMQEAGISLTNLNSSSIRLFYGGGMPLPEENGQEAPEFREIAVMIRDGGDGQFGIADSILFFAEGADRWRYPLDSIPEYLENHFTDLNTYWLTMTGDFANLPNRMTTINGAPVSSPDTTIVTGRFQARAHQNNELYVGSDGRVFDYYNWYWSDDSRLLIREWLPQAISGEIADIWLRAKSGFNVVIQVNNQSESRISVNRSIYTFESDNLTPGWNNFYVLLDEGTSLPTYVDYLEVSYMGNLIPDNNKIDFRVDGFSGRADFVVAPAGDFDTAPMIFDLSDAENPISISGGVISQGELRFGKEFNGIGPNRFYLVSPTTIAVPDNLVRTNVTDIRGSLAQTDLYIIAPDELISPLSDYETYREELSNVDISLVSFNQILYNFSYGLYDPVAVRDFLKYAYDNAPASAPAAVLLVGDGTFDFENNLNTATVNHIPPYIHSLDSSSSDDNYVYFGEYGLLDSDTTYPGDRGYDMMIARWPAKTVSEIRNIMDKVESYESSTGFGPWRTTVTLVADDEFGAFDTEWFHTSQTEELQEPPRLPASFRRQKIYLWDYPFDSNREKPTVNDEIVHAINQGTLLINYVGHGNPDTWAHEHVFNRNTDLPLLHNSDKLPLVSTFSCSIGFFDDPTREGMAEDLLSFSGGGAIGVISATRLVYSSDNSAFNKVVFDVLFGSDSLSICQTFFAAKILRQYSGGDPQTIRNDRNYAYFGDPFVKLQVPKHEVKITEKPDSLIALGAHHVAGEIVIKGTDTKVDFDGSLQVFVYDSDREKSYKVINEFGDSIMTVNYALDGPVIYRGNVPVTGGDFDLSFIAPLDIGYGGNTARITGYASSAEFDALGLADSIPVRLEIGNITDIEGPEIHFTFGGNASFISGDRISVGETLNLTIIDSSGVNLTGSLGHGITLIIDDAVDKTLNLTDEFEYEEGSYTIGTIDYNIGDLQPGIHSFKIKAWDNANNSSVAEFDAEIIEGQQMLVFDLMNYPNPMSERTTFSFSLSSSASSVKLELFTLSGRRIKEFRTGGVPSGYNEFFTWDGRDADLDRVATGVYIYKLTAVAEDNSEAVESFGKIIVLN